MYEFKMNGKKAFIATTDAVIQSLQTDLFQILINGVPTPFAGTITKDEGYPFTELHIQAFEHLTIHSIEEIWKLEYIHLV
jgi:hypothetical protein